VLPEIETSVRIRVPDSGFIRPNKGMSTKGQDKDTGMGIRGQDEDNRVTG